ncbi:hypothetical protein ACQEVH_12645 [Streptomyces lavendofoliae]
MSSELNYEGCNMNFRAERHAYKKERPKPYDYGYSMSVLLSAEDQTLRTAVCDRASDCRVKADACESPDARREWLTHVDELYEFVAESL